MMGKKGRRKEGWSWSKKTKGQGLVRGSRDRIESLLSPRCDPFSFRCERKFFFFFFFFFEDFLFFFFFASFPLSLSFFLFRNTLRFSVLDSALSNFSFFTPCFSAEMTLERWSGEGEEEEEGRMERGRKESKNDCLILLQHTSGPTFVFFADNESRKYQGTRAFYWINRVSLLSNFVLWF